MDQRFGRMFWNFFVIIVRVEDLATAQPMLGIIAGVRDIFPHLSLIDDLWDQGSVL